MKKWILGAGSLVAVASPVALAVSCGSESKKDNNDKVDVPKFVQDIKNSVDISSLLLKAKELNGYDHASGDTNNFTKLDTVLAGRVINNDSIADYTTATGERKVWMLLSQRPVTGTGWPLGVGIAEAMHGIGSTPTTIPSTTTGYLQLTIIDGKVTKISAGDVDNGQAFNDMDLNIWNFDKSTMTKTTETAKIYTNPGYPGIAFTVKGFVDNVANVFHNPPMTIDGSGVVHLDGKVVSTSDLHLTEYTLAAGENLYSIGKTGEYYHANDLNAIISV